MSKQIIGELNTKAKISKIAILKSDLFAIVDDCDFESMSQFKWYLHTGGYAVRNVEIENIGRKVLLMHRSICSLDYGDRRVVDHINGNKLDNRKINLRVCHRMENARNQILKCTNTSGYKGVSFVPSRNSYIAYITANNKRKTIGYFKTPELAHEAYKTFAQQYHGSFANFGFGSILNMGA